ncbi:MAG: formylglycine-generating enzyme family protein [Desulfobacterales bacterium]|jgi:formylglycine-generating enzyme required for sulfatase activity|nr:formylglycine-generating enzyme family protein [Desulfobacterales bacterium]
MSKMTASRMFSGFIAVLWVAFSPLSVSGLEKTYTNSLGMTFVLLSPGTFTMGSPPSEPFRGNSEIQHQVTISKLFYMQATEVTVKQWQSIMGKRMLTFQKNLDNMPVTRVSWYDCMKFIQKLNRLGQGTYRLPTEAEWEYAARAGTSTAYSWGDTIDCDKAMYANNSLKDNKCQRYIKSKGLQIDQPAPGKSYAPNPWGLYDMPGNVWEWCRDRYGAYKKSPVTDPTGPESGSMRIRRGGSWFKYGHYCRSANRNYGNPATRYRTTGFRLVREFP